jgi:hypothetical protein
VLSFQSSGVEGTELYTPKADRFADDGYASFGLKVFDIAMTQIEAVVQPDSVCKYSSTDSINIG